MVDVIRVAGLRKQYGAITAVEDVTFRVGKGEIFGILGPNGAGKTTTVECLQGLRIADGGEIDVLGFDPRTQADHLRRRVGSQLQESALPDRMRVWEALDLFSSLGSNGVQWQTVMEKWGLADKADRAFGALSGGEQQRLFIALALVNNPEIVFLDEMTTGLDPSARRVAWELIEEIRSGGTTVVLVTHFMDEAERLCDRLIIIDRHRVVAGGTPQELIHQFGGEVRVTFSSPEVDPAILRMLPGVTGMTRNGSTLEITGSGSLLTRVAAELAGYGLYPEDLAVKRATLEDVFLRLTRGAE